LAQIISGFKTRILAIDKYPIRQPAYVESLWGPERLNDLLAEVDILYLAAPLTAETRGLIDAARLERMKPSALLINMARGPLVVERDLVAALERGELAGAALDVTEIEPLPASSRLWDLPNVVITPHVAGQSARRIDDMADFFCDNLGRYLNGRPLRNLVDKQQGFPLPVEDPSLAGPS
jgi:D-3-phosphoglycerate dehydrogenase